MGASDMPVAEVDIDEGLVRALLEDQHPDLADRPITPLAFGWDNVLFRLGDDLTVRLPRRTLGAQLLDHELRWLPELAPTLPLPSPVALRRGEPGPGYPWSWAICPWLPGDVAALVPPAHPHAAAAALGSFVAALHRPAPPGAPVSDIRGCPLADRSETTLDRLAQVADDLADLDAVELRARFLDLVTTEPWAAPPVWVHGDLHPANLLVLDGAVSAVLDWGDLNAGDPATDLAVAWMLLPRGARATFRAAAGVDDATWRRGSGWALVLGVLCVASSADNALIDAMGRRTLAAVLADPVP